MVVRFCLTYCFLFFYFLIKSQNYINVTSDYITNPSFEDYTACPEGFSDPTNYWIDSCKGWSHVTYASPDLLTACSSSYSPLFGVPNNYAMIYQWPFHGDSYLGFFAHVTLNNKLWCEYVQTKIKRQLTINRKYKFTMRLSTANHNLAGVSKIGVHLSNNSLSNPTQETSFKFSPTMLNNKGCLYDTTNWMLFEEEFVATGLENYITIGWFADTTTNDCGYFDPDFNQYFYGPVYYGLDSINLQEYQSTYNINDFSINVITPNNDGANDYIDFSKYELNTLKFNVYNRWGNKIFGSEDVNLKWWGKNNYDNPLSDGVYYYTLEADLKDKIEQIKKIGHISIIH